MMKRNEFKKNLKKNLKALKATSELLAKDIEAGEFENPAWLGQEIKNRDGSLNWTMKTRTGLASIDDIDDVMKGKDNTMIMREKKPRSEVTIIIGIGCGHILNQILKGRDKEHTVIVVEPVLALIKTALCNYDLSKELDHDILFASNESEMYQILTMVNESYVIETYPIIKDSYTIVFPETYMILIKETMDTLNNISAGVGTAMSHGVDMAFNDIRNLPYCLPHPGVKHLKDRKKGCPIVMVSTGPSLSKNIMALKEKQENVFIVAVGQAMRILLAHDIRPDIACSVDFGKVNMSHYEGLFDQDVPMVFLNRTYSPLLQSYRGPKYIASNNPEEMLSKHSCAIINNKGHLAAGGSVAHFALSLSVYLGGSPIMIIGQDLALTGDKSHFDQADSAGEIKVENGWIYWEVNDPNSPLFGEKNSMGPADYVEGYFGEDALTNCGLASFVFSFENLMSGLHKDAHVINCTEGGANIKGMEKMSLQKSLETHAREKVDKTLTNKFLDLQSVISDIDETRERLTKDINNMSIIVSNSEKGIKENNKAKVETSTSKLKGILAKNETYSKTAHEATKEDPLLSLAIYQASRRIFGSDMQADGKNLHKRRDEEDFTTRLKRNEFILDAALKGAKDLKELYEEVKELLDSVTIDNLSDTLNNKVHKEHDPNIAEFREYLEKGNYSYPITFIRGHREGSLLKTEILEEAVKMRNKIEKKIKSNYHPKETDKKLEYNRLIEDARLIGREKDNFEKAKTMLEDAIKLYPKDPTAIWGLASSYHYIGEHEKSVEAFDKLIKKYPDNLQFQFEAGHVALNIDLTEGFKRIGQVMEKTEIYDHYLAPLSRLYIEAKRPQEALTLLETYIDKFPLDLDVLQRLKDLYISLDMQDKASEVGKKLDDLSTTN